MKFILFDKFLGIFLIDTVWLGFSVGIIYFYFVIMFAYEVYILIE